MVLLVERHATNKGRPGDSQGRGDGRPLGSPGGRGGGGGPRGSPGDRGSDDSPGGGGGGDSPRDAGPSTVRVGYATHSPEETGSIGGNAKYVKKFT